MSAHDIFSILNISLSVVAFFYLMVLAKKQKRFRPVFCLVSLFCLYMTGLYCYILFKAPEIGLMTALLGRVGVTAILTGIIMMSLIADR